MLISRLKEAGLRGQHAVVKELLNDEHKLYRLAFAESNVERSWDSLIFSNESTFSSANDGPVLVDRLWGEHYNSMSTCTCCCHVSLHCWAASPMELESSIVICGIEIHLDSLPYKHILQNVIVPSV